jgi:hypothetical protein
VINKRLDRLEASSFQQQLDQYIASQETQWNLLYKRFRGVDGKLTIQQAQLDILLKTEKTPTRRQDDASTKNDASFIQIEANSKNSKGSKETDINKSKLDVSEDNDNNSPSG